LHQQGDGQLAIFTNSHERVRVDPNGRVGIGTDSPAHQLDVNGDIHTAGSIIVDGTLYWKAPLRDSSDQQSTPYFQLDFSDYPTGNHLSGGHDLYITSGNVSDLQLKRDVRSLEQALPRLRRLRGVTYHWNETAVDHAGRGLEQRVSAGPQASDAENQAVWAAERAKIRTALAARQIGLIAQDVEKVAPEAVHTGHDGYKRVDYPRLTALLVEAIKELAAEVQILKASPLSGNKDV
ncbi:MAG: tail fiber domain-containing protein, partial [Anaerolineales bacterium]|nr:tail fiber domain-containing protein [Anaerolineales bacterium]